MIFLKRRNLSWVKWLIGLFFLGALLAWVILGISSTSDATAAALDGSINITGFSFSPNSIEITAGETITWTNLDPSAHTVTGSGWGSDDLNQNDAFASTFNESGTFDYICSIHPSMTGQVIVSGSAPDNAIYLPVVQDGREPIVPITGAITSTKSGSWSDPEVWGGSIPQSGELVYIQPGHLIVLDIDSAGLDGLVISGQLLFSERDLMLTSDWIMVHGANSRLQIGTEDRPFQKQGDHYLDRHKRGRKHLW